MPAFLSPRVFFPCIAIAITIAVTSSCACPDVLFPAPGVTVVDAEGNAVDDLVLHLLAPGGEAIILQGSPGGFYGVGNRELAAGTYQVVLDSDAYVISGADALVVHDYGCTNSTGSAVITLVPVGAS